jgi:hypothetical protein
MVLDRDAPHSRWILGVWGHPRCQSPAIVVGCESQPPPQVDWRGGLCFTKGSSHRRREFWEGGPLCAGPTLLDQHRVDTGFQ